MASPRIRCGFNEAAALLPRKRSSSPRARSPNTGCFNEAAALLPRKSVDKWAGTIGDPRLQGGRGITAAEE